MRICCEGVRNPLWTSGIRVYKSAHGACRLVKDFPFPSSVDFHCKKISLCTQKLDVPVGFPRTQSAAYMLFRKNKFSDINLSYCSLRGCSEAPCPDEQQWPTSHFRSEACQPHPVWAHAGMVPIPSLSFNMAHSDWLPTDVKSILFKDNY